MESAVHQPRQAPGQQPRTPSDQNGSSGAQSTAESPCENWLGWQCRLLKGVLHASLFTATVSSAEAQSASPANFGQRVIPGLRVASWPDAAIKPDFLQEIAGQALLTGQSVTRNLSSRSNQSPSSMQPLVCMAVPLSSGHLQYAVVLVMTHRSSAEQDTVNQLLQWGSHWLPESYESPDSTENTQQAIVRLASQQSSFYASSMTLVVQLAETLGCDRVSLGWITGDTVEVIAISGIATIDKRTAVVKDITGALQECCDQGETIQSCQGKSGLINRRHSLMATSSDGACCSIPIFDEDQCIGALLLEKPTREIFYPSTIRWCQQIMSSMVSVLSDRYAEHSSGSGKALEWTKQQIRRLLPGKLSGLRFTTAAVLFVILCASFIPATYHVTAVATLEGKDRQVVVAPYDGYVRSADARAGQNVEAGQAMASLDDRALTVQLERWSSELGKIEKSYSHALATGDRLELRMLQSRREEIEAEHSLVQQKIERAQLTAPFAGVIVRGDLNQMLGAPVEAGQVLYEVASADSYRLVLEVDEHQIARVSSESQGYVRLSALPGDKHPITLSSMLPIAGVADNRNVFRLEAIFTEKIENLRPGMRGYAQLESGTRTLLWTWTEGLMHRLRVFFWSLGF